MTEYQHNDTDTDADLLSRLARLAVGHDPVPAAVVEAARGSYAWRTIDDELAELVYDSWLDWETSGVRASGGGSRQLTFEAESLTVEMEVSGRREIVGQIVPPQRATIEFRHPSSGMVVEADHLGRFAAVGLPAGAVSLRCKDLAGAATVTDWLVL